MSKKSEREKWLISRSVWEAGDASSKANACLRRNAKESCMIQGKLESCGPMIWVGDPTLCRSCPRLQKSDYEEDYLKPFNEKYPPEE